MQEIKEAKLAFRKVGAGETANTSGLLPSQQTLLNFAPMSAPQHDHAALSA
jgi:hypothetical protein